MCGKTLIFLQIICGFSFGLEPRIVYEHTHHIQGDSVQRNLNLELLKITQQIQIGHDIELHCGSTESSSSSSSGGSTESNSATKFQSPTSWHFRACGHGFNQSSCNTAMESQHSGSWQKLQCSTNNNYGSSLILKNLTERDSGLYRCSIYPFKPELKIQVVKTYFLDVRNTTIPAPIIVEGPKNASTPTDSQVVFQCCVNSLIRPSITWFKRQEGLPTTPNGTTNIIEYSDIHGVPHIYAQLESAGERLLTEGVYLSKLILNGVTEHDAGFYVCVAINYGGYKIQEGHLNVSDTYDDDDNEHEPSIHSLLLLFLIPVGLALAPLTLWICYVLFKLHGLKEVDHKIDTNGNDYIKVNRIIVL